jgi:cobalt/nickel transport system permease protein
MASAMLSLIIQPELALAPRLHLHAPDGFLSVPVAILMWALTVVALAISTRKVNQMGEAAPSPALLGVTAAFIFAAQMFNFQVVGGTSGHLLGGVLAAVLLGPWAATIVMACVIGVQALVFQDGGLLALGANIFNMGVVGTLGGYAVYATLSRILGHGDRGRIAAVGIAAWMSVVAGAVAISLELAVSGSIALGVVLPVMVSVHALIGIGEALISMAAVTFVAATRADLLYARSAGSAA